MSKNKFPKKNNKKLSQAVPQKNTVELCSSGNLGTRT